MKYPSAMTIAVRRTGATLDTSKSIITVPQNAGSNEEQKGMESKVQDEGRGAVERQYYRPSSKHYQSRLTVDLSRIEGE
jgi:hypothetical protein